MMDGTMCAQFRDPVCQLMVLDAAWSEGVLPHFDKIAFYRDSLGVTWDYDAEYSRRIDLRVQSALLAIALPPDVLARITQIVWNGGNDVCGVVWSQWDGETDEFDVTDLGGIEACTGLRCLELSSAAAVRSVEPLGTLHALEELDLSGNRGPIQDLHPLRALPRLRQLELGCNYVNSAPNQEVLRQLKARGVQATTIEDAAEQRALEAHRQDRERQLKRASTEANTALYDRRWADAVQLLEPFESELSDGDRMRLEYARKKAST